MTDLILVYDKEPAKENHIKALINNEEWDNIFIISYYKEESFNQKITRNSDKIHWLILDKNKKISDLKNDLINKLKDKLGFEVALNIIGGDGKQHMFILSALINLGVGIRLVTITKERIIEEI